MLEKLNKCDFNKMYALLQRSFPLGEYRSYETHRSLLDKPGYTVYARYDDGQIAGILTFWEFEDFAFIEHFAVAPECRNRGVGGQMLKQLQEKLDKMLCLEAEPPVTEIARRRIGFYKRNGFFLNAYPYVQPQLGEGRNAVALQIMTTGGEVSAEIFDRIKRTLYTQVYNAPLA